MPQEYECIVEFSFNPKQERFVVRFLDGKSYALDIIDLPKKMQTKKPAWEDTYLAGNKSALVIEAGKEIREIPAFMIHSKGKEV
ncbi:MAG: hypothetical protein ACXAC5_01340 [Promethearchaeota archaeon]|jgi:hypothetical protein